MDGNDIAFFDIYPVGFDIEVRRISFLLFSLYRSISSNTIARIKIFCRQKNQKMALIYLAAISGVKVFCRLLLGGNDDFFENISLIRFAKLLKCGIINTGKSKAAPEKPKEGFTSVIDMIFE